MYLLIVLLPVVVFTFFAYLYRNALVREIPIVVYDEDQTEMSRLLIRYFDATSSMAIERNVNSLEELRNEILSGNAYAGFYFPARMEEDIKSGKHSDVVILESAANMITGNTIMRDALTISKTVSGGILLKKIRSNGWTQEQAIDAINPVTLEVQSLFNPNYSYLNYLVPGLMIAILQMIIMATSVLVINSEFNDNTFLELVRLAGGRVVPMMIGKSLPHIALHSVTMIATIGIIFPLFGIVINGSIIFTILFSVFFVMAVVAVSMFLSTLFHDQMFASEVMLILGTPAFLFSGFTYPGWAMPMLHQWWAQLLPSTHFLLGFLKVYQMDVPVRFMIPEVLKLGLFLIGSFVLTYVVLKKKITIAAHAVLSMEGER
jgi:ABC-2 type transport system permease protein